MHNPRQNAHRRLGLRGVLFAPLLLAASLSARFAAGAAADAESALGLGPWRDDPYTVIQPQAGTHALAIWQISHDWDVGEGNWKKNPFSANGRYVHFMYAPRHESDPYKTLQKGRVLYDLHLQRSRRVALNDWLWAWESDWAFLQRPEGPGGLGPLLKWDLDSGEVSVAHPAFGKPLAVGAGDRYLFASMSAGSAEEGPLTRLDIETGELKPLPYQVSPRLECHPFDPVIALQKNNYRLEPDGARSLLAYNGFLDLDGRFIAEGFDPALAAHTNWSGGGAWFVSGDGPLMGRRWDAGWPVDWECLSSVRVKDPQMCGLHRGLCVGFSDLLVETIDVRTGEHTPMNYAYSGMVLPREMAGDQSHLYDIEAHGSPDGTKIYWSGTCDIANLSATRLTEAVRENADSLPVESTEGFPPSGIVVVDGLYAAAYRSKTPHSFDGVEGGTEGTRWQALKAGWTVVPISALNLADGGGIGRPRLRNSFVTAARLPDPPALAIEGGGIALYPGAHHRETRAYRFRIDGRDAGETAADSPWTAPQSGSLRAAAVEWSNLQSEWSAPVECRAGQTIAPRAERPAWLDEPKTETVSSDPRIERVFSPRGLALEEREYDSRGQLVRRDVLSETTGKICKSERYEQGKIAERRHFDDQGAVLFRETYGADGWKTEDWRAVSDGEIALSFEKGVPVERVIVSRNAKGETQREVWRPTGKPKEWIKIE